MLLHPLPQTDQHLWRSSSWKHPPFTFHISWKPWILQPTFVNNITTRWKWKCEYHVPQTFFHTWWFLEHAPAIGWKMLPPLQEAPTSANPPPPFIHSNGSSNTCCTQFLYPMFMSLCK
jgi:hypothetical protein